MECEAGEIDRVGTHVSDETSLVKSLRHTHRVGDAHTELARSLLLERTRGEWCRWRATPRLLLNLLHGKGGLTIDSSLHELASSFLGGKVVRECRSKGFSALGL